MTTTLVCIVDDDDAVRLSMTMLVETLGHRVRSYPDAQSLLDDTRTLEQADCILLDVRMPGLSGIGTQERLQRIGNQVPIIFVSGHGDVPMVAKTMRAGAFDFIQKPFNDQMLLDRVQEAIQHSTRRRAELDRRQHFESHLHELTPREREVMDQVLEGRLNKQIAYDLDISIKTVEQHRARIMQKMGVGSLAELVRLVTLYRARVTTETAR